MKIDPNQKNGEHIIIYDVEDKEVSEDLLLSLGEYLEDLRNNLLSKKLFYEDELGLVSVQ